MKAICFLLEEEEYHSYTFWVEKPYNSIINTTFNRERILNNFSKIFSIYVSSIVIPLIIKDWQLNGFYIYNYDH